MNIAILRGNVGEDPRVTDFENGGKVARFSLATTERGFETSDGKKVEDKTTWHNIVVKRTGLAGVCEKYVKKGTPLLIVGRTETRSYEDNAGQKRYVTEVNVTDLELLGSKGERQEAPAPEPEDFKGANRAAETAPVEHIPMVGAVKGDDLPFNVRPGASR